MGLAERAGSAGRFVEADSTFDRASKVLATLGRDDTQEAGTLFNNWGLMLFHSGRILEAEERFAVLSRSARRTRLRRVFLHNFLTTMLQR